MYKILLFVLFIFSFTVLQAGSWVECADEGDFCNFQGKKRVAYGQGLKWTYKNYSDGVACSYKKFTPDNAPDLLDLTANLNKCKYFNPWDKCADEGRFCRFAGTRQVAFGAHGNWLVKKFTGGVHCSSQQFGRIDFNPTKINSCIILGPDQSFVNK